jgi:hypothetical protein
MRVNVPGSGDYWFELRDIDDLTGGDEEIWQRIVKKSYEKRIEEEANLEDGAPRPPLRLPAGWVQQREDDILAVLVTAWSFDAPESVPQVALPYSDKARVQLPLRVVKALRAALQPYIAAFEEAPGPKEPEAQTSTTDSSGSAST